MLRLIASHKCLEAAWPGSESWQVLKTILFLHGGLAPWTRVLGCYGPLSSSLGSNALPTFPRLARCGLNDHRTFQNGWALRLRRFALRKGFALPGRNRTDSLHLTAPQAEPPVGEIEVGCQGRVPGRRNQPAEQAEKPQFVRFPRSFIFDEIEMTPPASRALEHFPSLGPRGKTPCAMGAGRSLIPAGDQLKSRGRRPRNAFRVRGRP